MLSTIAYSALEGEGLVFGDTGIRALFDDLIGLGNRVEADASFLGPNSISLFPYMNAARPILISAIVEGVVQFAAEMALRKVQRADYDGIARGIIAFSEAGQWFVNDDPSVQASSGDVMYINLSAPVWDAERQSGATGEGPIGLLNWLEGALIASVDPETTVFFEEDFVAGLVDDVNLPELLFSVYGQGDIDRGWAGGRIGERYINSAAFLLEATPGSAQLALLDPGNSAGSANSAMLVVGTTENDNIGSTEGADQNEIYALGLGNDTVMAENGKDIVFGGLGSDSLDGGAGDDLLVGDPDVEEDFGNDTLDLGTGFDTAVGGGGNDTILGDKDIPPSEESHGHSDIYGGEGSDSIDAGDGADYVFDNGVTSLRGADETDEAYYSRLQAYDSAGNDIVYGGAGSDWLVYSGGNDTFYGGAGDDVYLTVPRTVNSSTTPDNLTIILSENSADPESLIGHDLIAGNGRGVDRVIFEGINLSDVTIRYSFEAVANGTTISNFNPLFPWTLDPLRTEINHFVTIGSIEIVINETGSSLTIEQVIGYQTQLVQGISFGRPEASIAIPFVIQFADGLLDWAEELLDWSGSASGYAFVNTPLSSTAFDAQNSFLEERDEFEDTAIGSDGGAAARSFSNIDPITGNDVLVGSNGASHLRGLAGNDLLSGMHGNDSLEGGVGADTLDGGSGRDTASYENATGSIGLRLFDTQFRTGDAVGDVLISIENITGSAFNDLIVGDTNDNVLRGGGGNDSVYGGVGNDSLYGGDGNDVIEARFNRNNERSLIDGGNGNDTVLSSGGHDTISGGAGADTVTVVSTDVSLFPTTYRWGATSLDGGLGVDTLVVSTFGTGAGAVIDMVAGRYLIQNHTGGYGVTQGAEGTFSSFENLTTGGGNETVYGDDQANVIRAEAGNDSLHGGDGNDTLWGGDGNDVIFGGVGIDTAAIDATRGAVTFTYVEGGIRGTVNTSHPSYVAGMDTGTFTIFDDVEFIRFNDMTVTYQSIAAGLQTAFAVINDYVRVDEGVTPTLSLFANDLPFQAMRSASCG